MSTFPARYARLEDDVRELKLRTSDAEDIDIEFVPVTEDMLYSATKLDPFGDGHLEHWDIVGDAGFHRYGALVVGSGQLRWNGVYDEQFVDSLSQGSQVIGGEGITPLPESLRPPSFQTAPVLQAEGDETYPVHDALISPAGTVIVNQRRTPQAFLDVFTKWWPEDDGPLIGSYQTVLVDLPDALTPTDPLTTGAGFVRQNPVPGAGYGYLGPRIGSALSQLVGPSGERCTARVEYQNAFHIDPDTGDGTGACIGIALIGERDGDPAAYLIADRWISTTQRRLAVYRAVGAGALALVPGGSILIDHDNDRDGSLGPLSDAFTVSVWREGGEGVDLNWFSVERSGTYFEFYELAGAGHDGLTDYLTLGVWTDIAGGDVLGAGIGPDGLALAFTRLEASTPVEALEGVTHGEHLQHGYILDGGLVNLDTLRWLTR